MEKSAMEVLIENIKETKAEYPSVLMHIEDWMEILNEIERLKAVEGCQKSLLTPEQIEKNRLDFMWSL